MEIQQELPSNLFDLEAEKVAHSPSKAKVAKAPAKADKPKAPKVFGPSYPGSYPSEMRTQLWPLCCGARIISGFKDAANYSHEELVSKINSIIDESVPDHQVFGGEQMMPKLVFLTLNSSQTASKKIMAAVNEAGFVKFGEGKPRGHVQSFFIKDMSNSFKTVAVEKGVAT